VERKTINDTRDFLKTVVGFANTLDPSEEGVLFIGVTDKGEIQSAASNLDSLQKTFSEKISSAYPTPYYTTMAIAEGGRECLAIIVPGSPNKPHFAGKPYVRDGSQTRAATDEQYEVLLSHRIDKSSELQRWTGKAISLTILRRQWGIGEGYDVQTFQASVIACNRFYLTIRYNNNIWSHPLSRIEISFDHGNNRLEVQVTMTPNR
jgi:hypothetical protein